MNPGVGDRRVLATMLAKQFRHVLVAIERRLVQRRVAVVVPGIDLGLVGQQQFRHVLVAPDRRIVQRRRAVVVPGIDLGLVGQQQFRHVLVAIKRRHSAKASSPLLSLALTSALLASSNSATSLWPSSRRPVQRRPAVVVFAENQIRIVFEQRLDLFQVAIPGRVMNLAAEGEAAPSQ